MIEFHGVSVGRGVLRSAPEEFAADEAAVNVRGGFEGDAAVGGEVKVECGAVDAVEVRAAWGS
eukprot:scaffold94905_cov36-Cyclotella_meneghiniana.AAC.8